MKETPKKILFFGKTGVGKSTTANILFNLNFMTDDSVACTKTPQLEYDENNNIEVIDMPGIGESLEADELYMSFYKEWVPQANGIVWITQSNTRGYRLDQEYILLLKDFIPKNVNFILGLGKFDLFAKGELENNFEYAKGQPSQEQLDLFPLKKNDVFEVFADVAEGVFNLSRNNIIPFSAKYRWGMKDLKSKILSS